MNVQRSLEITTHDNAACPECRGASAGAHDHFALGKLRQQIGMELGLDYNTSQQMDLPTLLDRWHAR